MPEIVVHHLENSRSLRVLWALEELGLEYRIKPYARDPKTFRGPPELREVHPLGKSPVVVIDGGTPLAESGAILEYLVERFGEGRLRPTDPELLQRYRYFLHYAEGSVMAPLLVKLILHRIRTAPVPFFVKPITKQIASQVDKSYARPEVEAHFAFIEQSLCEHPWFAGPELTMADIQMSYPIQAAGERAGTLGPKTKAWVERLSTRPAYQAAVARGGANSNSF